MGFAVAFDDLFNLDGVMVVFPFDYTWLHSIHVAGAKPVIGYFSYLFLNVFAHMLQGI